MSWSKQIIGGTIAGIVGTIVGGIVLFNMQQFTPLAQKENHPVTPIITKPQVDQKSSPASGEARADDRSGSFDRQLIAEIREKLFKNRHRIPSNKIREVGLLIDTGKLKKANALVNREVAKAEGWEQAEIRCADYKNIDTDGDGISDIDECKVGLNPMFRDSDGDGYDDNVEITYRTDPKDIYNYPNISLAKADPSNIQPTQSSSSSQASTDGQRVENSSSSPSRPNVTIITPQEQQGAGSLSDSGGGGSFDFYIIILLCFVFIFRVFSILLPNNRV